jgi:uncharacterized repeat protein (TIGR01451 family)
VPFGSRVVNITPNNPNDGSAFCSLAGSCNLGTIANGGSASVTIALAVDSDYTAITLVNQAHVSSDQPDPNTGDNIANASTTITTQATLSINKMDLRDPVVAGETLPYQIRVTNSGPSASDAQNVVISDTLPTGTTFAGASDFCSEAGGLITCNVGTIPAGSDYSTFIELRVMAGLADGSTIDNTATVTAPGLLANDIDPEGDALTTVLESQLTEQSP